MTGPMIGRAARMALHAGALALAVLTSTLTPGALAQPCVQEWTAVGDGVETPFPGSSFAQSLIVWDDGLGGGPALYVGGAFTIAGGQLVNRIAKWDGQTWSPLGFGMDGDGRSVLDMVVFDDGLGGGPALYAVGGFNMAGGVFAPKVARWNGVFWSDVGGGMPNPQEYVYAAAVFDDGTGPALYAGGRFTVAGNVVANRLAKWDGVSWSAVGPNDIDLEIYELAVFDDGSGPALYVGGALTVAGGQLVNRIAKWDGQTWSALGSGLNGPVLAMAVFDDGSGPALYVGGRFTSAGGVPASNIAKWNGVAWSAVGGGLDDEVRGLTVWDDGLGSGPALYAGGDFTTAGGVEARAVAKWDGTAWSPLGSGMTETDDHDILGVFALAGFDDGSGSALYAAGSFITAGGVPANHMARWSCNPAGACCMPSGACELRTEQDCALRGGVYHGDGVDCSAIPPCPQPPTGACCLPSGCIITWAGGCAELGGLYQGDDTVCGSCPTIFTEVEPNNNKDEANAVTLAHGDAVTGVSTADDGTGDPASPDYFRIRTPAAPPGIYRHDITLVTPTTPSNTPTIRFTLQQNFPGTWPCSLGIPFPGFDFIGQEARPAASGLTNTWYGFGKQEEIYYRVDGSPQTTGGYIASLRTTPITPIDLGRFEPGAITIDTSGQGHDNDTALIIFDSQFDPIPGYSNDNATVLGGAPADSMTTSFLRRDFAPGTYYMAIGHGALATSMGIPCDDGELFTFMADFPGALLAVDIDSLGLTDVSFSITDSAGTTPVAAHRPGFAQVAWFKFTVGGSTCRTDWDNSGSVNSADISAFLSSWLDSLNNNNLNADFDNSGSVNSADISAFLNQWLTDLTDGAC